MNPLVSLTAVRDFANVDRISKDVMQRTVGDFRPGNVGPVPEGATFTPKALFSQAMVDCQRSRRLNERFEDASHGGALDLIDHKLSASDVVSERRDASSPQTAPAHHP